VWGYIYTRWSLMGRLGLVSFGHGASWDRAYTVVMLWNHFGLSPWLGAPAALAFAALAAVVSAIRASASRSSPLLRARHARAVGGGAAW